MNRRNFLSLFALPLIPKQIINKIYPPRKLHNLYISQECIDDIRNWLPNRAVMEC